MNIALEVKDRKHIKLDDCLNQNEMEISGFHFSLEELSQYVTGSVNIFIDYEKCIKLDIFSDFSLCYEEIVESVNHAKHDEVIKNSIWFCEQGSDFYINYEIGRDSVFLEYKKGKGVGKPNNKIDDFIVTINKDDYIREWNELFQEIIDLFSSKLNKNLNLSVR